MPETETITPESLNRPITAEDVQEGDFVVVKRADSPHDPNSLDFELFEGVTYAVRPYGLKLGKHSVVSRLAQNWVITSITRPVAEQPALPNARARLVDLLVDAGVNSYDGADPDSTADAILAAGFVPAGSEREAALRDVTAKFRELGLRGAVDVMFEHFALVPEAEGEKAHPYGRDCSNKCREDAARLAEGEKA